MIQVTVDDQHPGHKFTDNGPRTLRIDGLIRSLRPLDKVELVVNGRIIPLDAPVKQLDTGAYQVDVRHELTLCETSWVALRCRYREGERGVRFAHTAPWHCQINGQLIDLAAGRIASPIVSFCCRCMLNVTENRWAPSEPSRQDDAGLQCRTCLALEISRPSADERLSRS